MEFGEGDTAGGQRQGRSLRPQIAVSQRGIVPHWDPMRSRGEVEGDFHRARRPTWRGNPKVLGMEWRAQCISVGSTAGGMTLTGEGGAECKRDLHVYDGRCFYVPTSASYFSVLWRNYISSILADG